MTELHNWNKIHEILKIYCQVPAPVITVDIGGHTATQTQHAYTTGDSTTMSSSGYRTMWVMVMFDLPTDTKKARREYTLFRKHLLQNGFTMLQYSVYVRFCTSKENTAVHVQRIKGCVPPAGEVRIITVTEKQFQRMVVFWGKMRKTPEESPRQLQLF